MTLTNRQKLEQPSYHEHEPGTPDTHLAVHDELNQALHQWAEAMQMLQLNDIWNFAAVPKGTFERVKSAPDRVTRALEAYAVAHLNTYEMKKSGVFGLDGVSEDLLPE